MGKKSTVYFKGVDALKKGLKERATLADVKKVVKMNGTEMTEQTKRNHYYVAPYPGQRKSGDLVGSITQEIKDGGLTTKTSPHIHYGVYQELGTRFFPGKFYLKRAHNSQSQKFVNDMKRLVK